VWWVDRDAIVPVLLQVIEVWSSILWWRHVVTTLVQEVIWWVRMEIIVALYTISWMDTLPIIRHHRVVIITLTIQLYLFNFPEHFQYYIAASVATKRYQIGGIMLTYIVHKSTNVPCATKFSLVVIIWKPTVKLNMLIKKIYFIDNLYKCDVYQL
jgi:hypothetical protein